MITRHPRAAAAALLALAALAGCAPASQGPGPSQQPTAAPPPAPPTPTTAAPNTWAPATPPAPAAPSIDLPAQTARVERITDGDTIVTSLGRVRVIGIDTPERGDCGYQEATDNAAALLPVGSQVVLTAVPGKDDTDRYGRLLRYVQAPDGTDLGLAQISGGYAVARYDSRDGYGAHPREDQYIAADAAVPGICGG